MCKAEAEAEADADADTGTATGGLGDATGVEGGDAVVAVNAAAPVAAGDVDTKRSCTGTGAEIGTIPEGVGSASEGIQVSPGWGDRPMAASCAAAASRFPSATESRHACTAFSDALRRRVQVHAATNSASKSKPPST